jgi:hypothetical protein
MLSTFAWFKDPNVQSLFLSPLIGAVMGVFLNLFPARSSQTSQQTFNHTHTTLLIHVRSSGSRKAKEDDWIFPASILGVLIVTWAYARYGEMGLQLWLATTLMLLSFNVAAAIIGVLQGQVIRQWLLRLIIPLLALIFSLWLIDSASANTLRGVAEVARERGMIGLFKVLDSPQRIWIITQGIGVVFGLLGTIVAGTRLLHVVSLSAMGNQSYVEKVWDWLARVSLRSGGGWGVFLLVLFNSLGYLLISGTGYRFLMSS